MAEFNFVKITENEIPNLDKNCGFVLKFSAPEYDKAKKEVKIAKYYLFGDKYRRMYNILFSRNLQNNNRDNYALGEQHNIMLYWRNYKQVLAKMKDKPSLAFINSEIPIKKSEFKEYNIIKNGKTEDFDQLFVTKIENNIMQFLETLIDKRTNPNSNRKNIIIFIFQFDKLGLDPNRFIKVLIQAASRGIYFVVDIQDETAFNSSLLKADFDFFYQFFPIRFENGMPTGEIKEYLEQFNLTRADITT